MQTTLINKLSHLAKLKGVYPHPQATIPISLQNISSYSPVIEIPQRISCVTKKFWQSCQIGEIHLNTVLLTAGLYLRFSVMEMLSSNWFEKKQNNKSCTPAQ